MRFGLVGGTYTARSGAVAHEEAINLFAESVESQGAMVRGSAYGGMTAPPTHSLYGTPGTKVFATLPESPTRALLNANGRIFAVGGTKLCELNADGTFTTRQTIASDGGAVSMVASAIELFIVSAGHAYCYTLADNTMVDVTATIDGTPVLAQYTDGYFIALLSGNKFRVSAPLDGSTWPGIQITETSVYAEDIVSIVVNHTELWVFLGQHTQVYQDTGSDNVFDAVKGAGSIEQGCISPFATCRLDNSVFWVGQDERGAIAAWRSNGYTPQRVSTYAVEAALTGYANITKLVSYSYQDSGHLFWVLYVPGADCSWVYDVTESLWHKRAFWLGATFEPHHSWNHVYAFGKHLIGDWKSAKIYELSMNYLDDDGSALRRVRSAPTILNEMERIFHAELTLDFQPGTGPVVPLVDGNNNPRPPQIMLRWSDDRGQTWSNEHIIGVGLSGQYKNRTIARRLGQSRYRVYEVSMTDPVPWVLVDGYLRTA